MSEIRVGVRELKAHLSQYLRKVKGGKSVLITEHGRPVGRIMPAGASLEKRVQVMVNAGLAEWNGQTLEAREPVVANKSDITVSDLLVQDREHEIDPLP